MQSPRPKVAFTLPQLTPIVQALDYIEAHLQRPVGVADMAEAVSYSLYHYCRRFNQATRHTPYDYLMRRRLAEAARDLLQTDRKVIEIALDYQFKSPEVFTRAFKRVHGIGPSQFRKRGEVLFPGLMLPLTIEHLLQIGKGCLSKPVLALWEPISLFGVMSHLKGEEDSAEEIWELLLGELERLGVESRGPCYGISWFLAGREIDDRLFMAAVDLPDLEIDHTALVSRRLPAQLYAGFVHQGGAGRLPLTLELIFHTWLPRSTYVLDLPMVVERFDRDQGIFASEREIWIPIREI
jgi:AraC family transcriptional regulator